MFEALTEKLNGIFKKLSGKGRLSEKDIDEALRQVRLALLEADVNFKVVKDFVGKIRERSLTAAVLESLTPGQQIIKIVHEELIAALGEKSPIQTSPHSPSIVMLVGLQGSGKTTTAAKLALHLRHSGQRPLLVAADIHRPAAQEQLQTLGKQLDIPVYREDGVSAQTVSANGLKNGKEIGATWVIVDTAGRLHIDEAMMKEVVEVKELLHPTETLLVVDAMTGQDAVKAAEEFNAKVGITGLIMTKMDGDARGGAALSVRWVTGVPIKFIGVGEKLDALEPFYPDRLATRILGMGDMLTLIEKAQEAFDEKKSKELERKMRSATIDLDDFLDQMKQLKKMGSLSQLLEMVPGMSGLAKKGVQVDEKQMKRTEAIILSMTPEERHNPTMIDGSRRRRIAKGSGASPQDVNRLLNQFHQLQQLAKQMKSGKMPNMASLFR